MRFTLIGLAWCSLAVTISAADRPDIVIADFEGNDYGAWKATGTAFGRGPARGTLPNQMDVTGYLGQGLVNTYLPNDGATGTLTSPEFTVQRKYINFLVGGGKAPNKTCINLWYQGKIVRTATGPNDKPGGSEHLDWAAWDVAELEGKKVTLQIVDEATGSWGHINIDHLVQSDQKKIPEPIGRTFTVHMQYLHLPVKTGAPKQRLQFIVDEQTVREFEIELAQGRPDFYVFADVGAYRNKKLTIVAARANDARLLRGIYPSEDLPDEINLYREKYRPQFHFTSRRGWLNDPNGLVFDGEQWHLFYQHNPFGYSWGNMHWGHAVSKDLLQWKEQPIALYPKAFGDWAFSGSAVLDANNTSGFGIEEKTPFVNNPVRLIPPLVIAYTSTGRGECIAYSTNQGRTWTEYTKNPVVKHTGRDPKLLWHAPSKQWVMAVYDEAEGKKRIAIYTAPDLKTWTYQSAIDDFYECPDLFELPIDGDPKNTRWVLHAADGKYLIGTFDGKSFTKESGKHQLWHGNFYAAQTFDNAPQGRRIQMGWANGITFPGMPFNQQMTIPVELTLRQTAAGPRLFAQPVRELQNLRDRPASVAGVLLGHETKSLEAPYSTMEVHAELFVNKAPQVVLKVRGFDLVYDVKKQTLQCGKVVASVPSIADKLKLHVLVDRGSIEVFANDGATAISVGHLFPANAMGVSVAGDGLVVKELRVAAITSAWK